MEIIVIDGYEQTNISLMKGDTWTTFPFSIEDENDNPIDLQGCTVYFTVKSDKGLSDNDAEIRKVINIASGSPVYNITIELEDSDWVGVEAGNYWYSIEVLFADDLFLTVFNGKCKILESA